MNDTRHFIIPGEPQGKGRPRFMRNGHTYTPDETRSYEQAVQYYYNAQCHHTPFEQGVGLVATIECIYGISKSASVKRKQAMLCGLEKPCKKPDADNAAKIVLDSLNGIAYHDDSQITTLHVNKRYGVEPCVKVWISKEE